MRGGKVGTLSLAVLALALGACRTIDLPEAAVDQRSPLLIGATAGEPLRTRSAVVHQVGSPALGQVLPVLDAQMSLSYSSAWNEDSTPTMALCRIEEGIGKIYRGGTPLQWKDIGGPVDSKASFTLDNVDERDIDASKTATDSDGEIISFGPDWSTVGGKYDAAAEQTAEGLSGLGNDILWGKAEARYGTHTEEQVNAGTDTPLHFELTHRMSRISVKIVNLPTGSREENIRVWLTNVITHPVGFNRANGEVLIPEDRSDESIYNDILLYDGVPGGTGEEFDTPNFIIPPEEDLFRRGSRGIVRPKLVIGVGERVFSAFIPQSMIYDEGVNNPGSGNTDYSVNLNFRASHHLTLRVKLIEGSDQPIIEFMPVMVEKWDYVFYGTIRAERSEGTVPGTFDSSEDLEAFIDLYNAQPARVNGISYAMVMSGATWHDSYHYVAGDDFFSSSDADYEQREAGRRKWTIELPAGNTDYHITRTFNPDYCRTKYYNSYDDSKVFGIYPVEIEFNGNTINGCSTTAELLGTGIRTRSDLETCIEWYNKANTSDKRSYFTRFLQFGSYEKFKDTDGVERCEVYIDLIGDITDWPSSFTKFQMKSYAPFVFRFNGHTINGVGSENDLKD